MEEFCLWSSKQNICCPVKPVGYAGNDGGCVNLQKAGSSHIKSGRENVNMEISKERHELSLCTYVCMWVRFSTWFAHFGRCKAILVNGTNWQQLIRGGFCEVGLIKARHVCLTTTMTRVVTYLSQAISFTHPVCQNQGYMTHSWPS